MIAGAVVVVVVVDAAGIDIGPDTVRAVAGVGGRMRKASRIGCASV